MKPVDLTQYADRYQLGWDEAATISGQSQEDRVWLRLIPCKLGMIFPWSDTELAAHLVGVRKSHQVERLPFVTVAQGGGGEIIVLFAPDNFEEMATFMGARRRRRLSEEHRAKLLRAGAAHQFPGRPGQSGSSRAQERIS